jgi:hypothetical protein
MRILLAGKIVRVGYYSVNSGAYGPALILALQDGPGEGRLRFSPGITKLLVPECFVAAMIACEEEGLVGKQTIQLSH